jgi:hypothetical protein
MKVFLVAYGGGHVAALAPVAKKLEAAGHDVVFLALTTARQYLEKRGIESIGFKDLLFLADKNVLELGEKLAAELPENNAVSHAESVAYMGMSFSDLIAEKGLVEAEELYAQHKRQAFLPVRTMRAAFEYYKPDVVVATNSPRAERAAIIAAGEMNIPSVCLVDLFAWQERKWIGVAGFANRICVLNNVVKEMFLECGRRDDEVVVTGNPAFDVLLTDEAREKGRKMRNQRGWNDGKINILFASQPEPEWHPFNGKMGNPALPDDIENVLRSFVASQDGFRLIVRYHPSQNCVFRDGKNVEFSPSSDEIAVVLHAVDMIITITSTVAIEAHILEKPVITVDKSIFSADAHYAEMGISVGVNSLEVLPDAILKQAELLNTNFPKKSDKKQDMVEAGDKVVEVIKGLGGDCHFECNEKSLQK